MKKKEELAAMKEEILHECETCKMEFAAKGCWNCNLLLCESCAFTHLLPRRKRSHEIRDVEVICEQRENDKKFKKMLRDEEFVTRENDKKIEEEEEMKIAQLKQMLISRSKDRRRVRKDSSSGEIVEIVQINFQSGKRFEGRARPLDNASEPYLPHGNGRLYRRDGKLMYDGNFKEGKRHGMGEYQMERRIEVDRHV